MRGETRDDVLVRGLVVVEVLEMHVRAIRREREGGTYDGVGCPCGDAGAEAGAGRRCGRRTARRLLHRGGRARGGRCRARRRRRRRRGTRPTERSLDSLIVPPIRCSSSALARKNKAR